MPNTPHDHEDMTTARRRPGDRWPAYTAFEVETINHDHTEAPPCHGGSDRHPLDYRPPTDDQVRSMQRVVSGIKAAWAAIEHDCPPSAERTLALRSLQEARSRANEAILGITLPGR